MKTAVKTKKQKDKTPQTIDLLADRKGSPIKTINAMLKTGETKDRTVRLTTSLHFDLTVPAERFLQTFLDLGRSGWVISGGETGSAARTTQKKWLTDLRDQCVSHGVAYFFKKWGKFHPDGNNVLVKLTKTVKEENPRVEHVLDGREWNELPAPNQSYLEKRDQILYFSQREIGGDEAESGSLEASR